ncbi:MAG TPA: hypothetical protein VF950_18705 [Planctomycetota bacterium]
MNELSDQELLDALERRRKRLGPAHRVPYVLGPLITALTWRPLGPFPAGALGFGTLLTGLIVVFLVARRLTWSRLDLLAFERGLHVRLSPEAMKHLTTERLKGVDAPRCVLHLQGMDLPHGGMLSVVLRVDDQSAELETRAASVQAPGVKLKRSSLVPEQARSLWEKVEAQFGTLESAERFPVSDGFPCELTIGLRDPLRVRRFVCNLSDPDTQPPIVQIAQALRSLAAPLVDMTWFATPRVERSEPLQG